MKLKYYGTAAAEGFPGMFCECDTCKRARAVGGRSIRTRSQSALDGRILIDACPDTYLHVLNHGLDLTKIKAVLITHSHFDHFDPGVFECLAKGKAVRFADKLDVYAGEKVCERLAGVVPERIVLHPVVAFESFETYGYTVRPVPAMHSSATSPFNYIITKDGRSILYAHDTGEYSDDVYDRIKDSGVIFDLLSLDCTYGISYKEQCDHHMNVDTMMRMVKRFSDMGMLSRNSVVVANHFSHFCGNTYDELCELTKNSGIVVSFDGMEVEI